MKKMQGYIVNKLDALERVPQQIQNNFIRSYCNQNKIHYLLSATEHCMSGCHMILDQLINKLDSMDGVVLYSLFHLPLDDNERHCIYKKMINSKKEFHFALENIVLSNSTQLSHLEDIWLLKKITINLTSDLIT